ncbi:hypothetical protein [Neobacillus muris]|nr:hypothetical protein [Neobacillus muris]
MGERTYRNHPLAGFGGKTASLLKQSPVPDFYERTWHLERF